MAVYKKEFKSSFNGKIYEIPNVCVDNFENPCTDGAKAYFLSHFHTDHTVGLQKYALQQKLGKEKNVFIYATKLTAAIIVYNYKHLKDYVKILNLGSNLITIPAGSEQDEPEIFLNVTLIPAGHCLGSSMFLFETTSVRVLYTGDFRIRSNDLSKYAAFHDKNEDVIKLDALYVDTTFIDPHENFPKRTDSIDESVLLIKDYLESNKDHNIILKMSATYGYEYVFNQIYKLLGFKVYVDDRKWDFYSTILHLVPGVTNCATDTRVFLNKCPESSFRKKYQYKIIKFSAIRWSNWNEDETSVHDTGSIAYVCFSTHCSRAELISFVEYFRPAKVVGFPSPYIVQSSPIEVSNKESFVLSPRKSPRKRPCRSTGSSGRDKKVDAATMRKLFG